MDYVSKLNKGECMSVKVVKNQDSYRWGFTYMGNGNFYLDLGYKFIMLQLFN